MLGSSGQQIDDLLNGFVDAAAGGFELAGRLVLGVGAVVRWWKRLLASAPQRRLWKHRKSSAT